MARALPPDLVLLLEQTSRTFFKTLNILPAPVRPQIGLAYLLARTSDTIADTGALAVEHRLQTLQKFSERVLGHEQSPVELNDLIQQQASVAERRLLKKNEIAIRTLEQFEPGDIQLIRDVIRIIISGQELDLRRFAGSSAENLIALPTASDLDDYTYRVAGCVGEFWTKICQKHLFPDVPLDEKSFLTDAVRFGKGLQLVNILRDLPADLRQGRCYLPEDELKAIGLSPRDLLQSNNEKKLRPLYNRYLALAESHLAAGWNYTNTIPRKQVRVRLACAWPILIGGKTIGRLRCQNVLDPGQRIKISRGMVRWIVLRSVLLHFWPAAWSRQFPTV